HGSLDIGPELSATKLHFSGPASGPHAKFLALLPGKQKCVSHSDPGLFLFDPEIERTLRRARQARRQAELARLALDNNPFDWSNSDSDSDTQTTSSNTGTFTMGERLILKQIGGASTAFGGLRVQVKHIPRKENDRVDTLSKLASIKSSEGNCTLIQETKEVPSTDEGQNVLAVTEKGSWRNPIIKFLTHRALPEDKSERKKEFQRFSQKRTKGPAGSTKEPKLSCERYC
ncbi:hypothetical protein PIB30_065857, partial [Stylosanthes scabra]|nr:hypothetical protein [Stylosanthes scabra]